ncbi:hypothetical protein TVAG_165310 [Trichomonas vaginalis G3]|uniref:RING-type E3 ubiquitin transferase n=1 Tax=Trichomonas vaginalis (strain ATCC PRA-98 / G3) TaxID=412133 RepID=A2DUL2_TRIV3|nr:E3 ubiquitin-protein ligase topors family [Trichomonas vaginalis G3]EAY15903.1 hypothetical protein TVAG_165310 [Trichomonas vaginalis G3]KAI5506636.1 E3 ubiquitin-protein ligase topors family [Trichomonas vaginalis G3]|eukprot:XP_001328126.1 hypothetical protein [Trichomonas vaginalis G3]
MIHDDGFLNTCPDKRHTLNEDKVREVLNAGNATNSSNSTEFETVPYNQENCEALLKTAVLLNGNKHLVGENDFAFSLFYQGEGAKPTSIFYPVRNKLTDKYHVIIESPPVVPVNVSEKQSQQENLPNDAQNQQNDKRDQLNGNANDPNSNISQGNGNEQNIDPQNSPESQQTQSTESTRALSNPDNQNSQENKSDENSQNITSQNDQNNQDNTSNQATQATDQTTDQQNQQNQGNDNSQNLDPQNDQNSSNNTDNQTTDQNSDQQNQGNQSNDNSQNNSSQNDQNDQNSAVNQTTDPNNQQNQSNDQQNQGNDNFQINSSPNDQNSTVNQTSDQQNQNQENTDENQNNSSQEPRVKEIEFESLEEKQIIVYGILSYLTFLANNNFYYPVEKDIYEYIYLDEQSRPKLRIPPFSVTQEMKKLSKEEIRNHHLKLFKDFYRLCFSDEEYQSIESFTSLDDLQSELYNSFKGKNKQFDDYFNEIINYGTNNKNSTKTDKEIDDLFLNGDDDHKWSIIRELVDQTEVNTKNYQILYFIYKLHQWGPPNLYLEIYYYIKLMQFKPELDNFYLNSDNDLYKAVYYECKYHESRYYEYFFKSLEYYNKSLSNKEYDEQFIKYRLSILGQDLESLRIVADEGYPLAIYDYALEISKYDINIAISYSEKAIQYMFEARDLTARLKYNFYLLHPDERIENDIFNLCNGYKSLYYITDRLFVRACHLLSNERISKYIESKINNGYTDIIKHSDTCIKQIFKFCGSKQLIQLYPEGSRHLKKMRFHKGYTIIHLFAERGDVEGVKYCIEKLKCKTNKLVNKKKPIEIARANNNIAVVKYLESLSPSNNKPTSSNSSQNRIGSTKPGSSRPTNLSSKNSKANIAALRITHSSSIK